MKKLNFVLLLLAIAILSGCGERKQQPIEKSIHAEELASKPADDWFLQRGWPDGQISMKAYNNGMEEAYAKMFLKGDWPGFDQDWTTKGPANIGARINTIAIHPDNDAIMFAGFSRGGVWRTVNAGLDWEPVFDEQLYLSIGDIAFDPNDPNTIYVGTGDPNISASFMIGDGIYRSTDGGDTWENIGLGHLNIITQIIVHPTDQQTIYAAAMGVPFERDNKRGLYRTTNGGDTWEQILFVSNQAGIIDLVMDHSNSEILYAASWDRIRNNQESIVSGPNAKIFKTLNGGDDWQQLGGGLPIDTQGRIGLAMAPQNPLHLYASYTGTNSQLYNVYESLDGGQNWEGVLDENSMAPISAGALGGFGWYFGKIRVNPVDENDIYVLGVSLWRSRDGGQNWEVTSPGTHADKHDLQWNSQGAAIMATDGGLYQSTNDMLTWEDIENIPCTQFYRVAINPHEPTYAYGGAQDNGSTGGANLAENWERIFGGDGFQMAFHPEFPEHFFAETQNGRISVTLNGGDNWSSAMEGIDGNDRRNWDMQYLLSPHDPDILYTGTYRVYQGFDSENPIWAPISEDLTDGLVLHPRYHSITSIEESPLVAGQLYVGTTDGNVWRNDGDDWTAINSGLPDRYVSAVKASPAFEDAVFVSMSAYKDYDFSPLLFRSTDRGENWIPIAGDLPNLAINDVYIYPNTGDSIIFVATDGGVYGTTSAGTNWQRIGNNMPFVAVNDLEINFATNELIAGTFARSITSYPLDSLIFGMPEPVRTEAFGQLDANLWLSPNPAQGQTQLIWEGLNSERTQLYLYDGQGRQLWRHVFIPVGESGREILQLPKQLPVSAYYLRIQQGRRIQSLALNLVR